MDQFEDPQEGIPLSALFTYQSKVSLNLVEKVSLSELILNPALWQQIPRPLQARLKSINAIQKTSYVTCWFADKRESVAMWNLYSNADGVAVKIPFGKLKNQLKINWNEKISAYYGGLVTYQDFQEIYSKPTGGKVAKVALRKDVSYSHEREFRFVVRTKDHHSEITGFESLPIDLSKLDMKVICHPRMPEWKKENIKTLLAIHQLRDVFAESDIRLR